MKANKKIGEITFTSKAEVIDKPLFLRQSLSENAKYDDIEFDLGLDVTGGSLIITLKAEHLGITIPIHELVKNVFKEYIKQYSKED